MFDKENLILHDSYDPREVKKNYNWPYTKTQQSVNAEENFNS
jgi:hypothetical protein